MKATQAMIEREIDVIINSIYEKIKHWTVCGALNQIEDVRRYLDQLEALYEEKGSAPKTIEEAIVQEAPKIERTDYQENPFKPKICEKFVGEV